LKEITETIKSSGKSSRDSYIKISNKSKNGFHLLTITDETFKSNEITIEYEAVENFIRTLNSIWKLHKEVNN
jgi:hypothetical protein